MVSCINESITRTNREGTSEYLLDVIFYKMGGILHMHTTGYDIEMIAIFFKVIKATKVNVAT